MSAPRFKIVLHLGCGYDALPARFDAGQWREWRVDDRAEARLDFLCPADDLSPVGSATMDAVVCQHAAGRPLAPVLAEIHRVLRPEAPAWIRVTDVQTQALMDALQAAGLGFVGMEQTPTGLLASVRRVTQPAPLPIPPTSTLSADALFEQGRQLHTAGQWQGAEALYAQAVAKNPGLWPAWFERGVVSFGLGRCEQAVAHVRHALSIEPRFARAHSALGTFLGFTGQHVQAAASLRRAIALEPQSAENHYNLGKALQEQNLLSEAEDAYRKALACEPQHALAQWNLGKVLNEQGLIVEGLALYQRAARGLTDPELLSGLPMLLNFVDSASDAEVYQAHLDFDQRFAQPLAPAAPVGNNSRDDTRRLRLGYLSGDFRQHSLGYFLLPILQHHDKREVEVTAYSTSSHVDAVTAQYRSLVDRWVDCHGLSDEALAQRIRGDGIDILVDLSGHTGMNRLLVLARRPAPIQLTYLGYPATTGLSAIDYRLSDAWIDPLPPAQPIASSEVPLRLAHGYFCYAPMPNSPPVADSPVLHNGFITFGSLNQGSKLSPQLLRAWAEILKRLPTARLCLQNKALHEARARQRMAQAFADLGVGKERLQFRPFAAAPAYLETYHRIDIALDSFPYNGGTTSCEALWMGVPVVSWCGTRHVGRLGASILNVLGLDDWVACSAAEYVELAVAKASEPVALQHLRQQLRQRMQASPLMDHSGFTRELEAALRTAWKGWCHQTR